MHMHRTVWAKTVRSVPVALLARCAPLLLGGLAAILAGCGGGEAESANDGPPRDITITKIALSDANPVAVGGVPVYFVGGVCGGGNGSLRARWTYDSDEGSAGVHTFPIPVAPKVLEAHTVRVKCTDASGEDFKWALDTLSVFVYAPGNGP